MSEKSCRLKKERRSTGDFFPVFFNETKLWTVFLKKIESSLKILNQKIRLKIFIRLFLLKAKKNKKKIDRRKIHILGIA